MNLNRDANTIFYFDRDRLNDEGGLDRLTLEITNFVAGIAQLFS